MEAGWLVAVIITPLFFNVYSSRVFEPDKVALLRSLALVMLAAWVVKSVSERAVGSGPSLQKLTTSWKAPLVVPVLAFAIVYLLSTALSVAPTRSLLGSYHRLQGTLTTLSYLVLFASVATHLRSRQQLERVLTAVVLTSLSVSIYAIFQRSGWDPLPWPSAPWAGSRTFASLGHPIFLGAYLMMAVFVVLGRLTTSVQAVLAGDPRRRFHTGRAAAYSAIVIVNLTAIAFTQSRGPVIGLYAGLVCYWLLLAAVGYARRLAVAALVLLAVPAVFVALLNVPDGPLRAMREWEGVSRFGQILDTREGSVRGRALIWNGVVTLMTPHAALEYPDGSPDRWNGLRPLVGYGPETLSVVFERFHPPELARLEGRSDSAWCCFVDRTHNETFDALVTTGALGVIVYLGLFAAIFYYGVTWLGLLAGRTRRLVCVCLTLGSTAVSAAVLSAWQGPAFLGLAVPVGMVAGLLTYLAVSALPVETAAAGARRTEEGGPAGTGAEPWRGMALVSLLSAIVAYFIETSFGIATVSTYAHFWIFAGLMLAVGRGTSDSHRAQDDVAGLIPSASPPPPWRDAMVTAGMLTVILVTLGYNYTALGSPAGPDGTGGLRGLPSSAALTLFLVTWLVGGMLAYCGEENTEPRAWAPRLVGMATSLAVGGSSWVLARWNVEAMARTAPTDLTSVLGTAERIAELISVYAVLLLTLVLALAWVFPIDRRPHPRPVEPRGATTTGGARMVALVAGYGIPPIAALWLVVMNLQTVHADMVYDVGRQFDDRNQPLLALPFYEKAVELAPREDQYRLVTGRGYLNAASSVTEPTQREALLVRGESAFRAGQVRHGLNTDHTAGLARLHRTWAALTADPVRRLEQAALASAYYQRATTLSPSLPALWNEWAGLSFQLLENPHAAQSRIDRSRELDPELEQTRQLQRELDAWLDRPSGTPVSRPSDPAPSIGGQNGDRTLTRVPS